MQEHKRHVKMYKAGKTWCMAAVTVAVVAVSGMTTVQADDSSQGTNNNSANTPVAVQAQNDNQLTDNQSNKDESTSTQSDNKQSSDDKNKDNQADNSQQGQVETNSTTQTAESSNIETTATNNSTVSSTNEQNDFANHNHFVSKDATSVDNVDGYITADAWYQPKDILKNGQNWEASTTNDRRPILMAWWPNKATQAAYINFMVDNHIVDGAHVDANADQSNLNSRSQAIQVSIEKRISSENSTDWLKPLFSQFKSSQSDWNSTSENPNSDGFQGGFIGYENSDKTPNTNSDYREMNRTPTRQDGTQKYFDDPWEYGGSEFLLANDVDNSNPAVQAEQLNWLHFLMNLGSITANDADANFDSYRFDAVDNVDADLLNIATDYMKAHFGIDQSEKNANNHFSILEDWNINDFRYVNDQGNNQLSMDQTVLHNLVNGLENKPNQREKLDDFYKKTYIDRQNNNTENVAEPNYSFVAAHDSDIQWMINDILKDLYPGTETLKATREQFDKAFEIYNKDRTLADKKYSKYNVPSAYSLLLTNKDTVPRVYYGDLYVDNAQYMSEKSPYFDAITQLMKDRVKYVSGGQAIQSDTQNVKTGEVQSRAWDMLTSVRYGKGLMNASDQDSSNNSQRTDGIGTIVSNNQNFALADGEEVVLHMGASHKNQMFRASLLTTRDGLKIYSSDEGAPTMQTDANGDLHFDNSWIYGVTDPQVSGYLAVWVPCGAPSNQDVRSFDKLSDERNADGRSSHSNAAFDSNLIFEGFSNFQPVPTTTEEASNAQIAKNAGLFKELGVTSFEFAPQYRSANDDSFIDSTIQNGYSFTDRYDLGFDNADGTPNPTKYGTIDQLRQAIKAVHAQGIQAMADFVPNQLYALPKQEAVTASKVNSFGQPIAGSELLHGVYIANSMSSGSDFQSVYGGKYLKELQEKYPQLFTRAQISNGKTLPTDEPITQWKAKYLNGTNIQGKGAFYALMEKSSGRYLNISDGSTFFLPDSLYSADDAAAAKKAADEAAAKKAADEAAAKKAADEAAAKKAADEAAAKKAADEAAAKKAADEAAAKKAADEAAAKKAADEAAAKKAADEAAAKKAADEAAAKKAADEAAAKKAADEAAAKKAADEAAKHAGWNGYLYDDDVNGWRWFEDGQLYTGFRYYADTYYWFQDGARQDNAFHEAWGKTYYTGADGRAVQGIQNINGQELDFGNDGKYYLRSTGYLWDGSAENGGYRWYEDGQLYTGFRYYAGTFYWFIDGVRQNAGWRQAWGYTYYTDNDGRAVQGTRFIDGKLYNFGDDNTFFERPLTGYLWDGSAANGGYRWYENGELFTGFRYYTGTYYWFIDGVRQNAGWREAWGYKYYTDGDGRAVQGWQNIDGQNCYFGDDNTYYLR